MKISCLRDVDLNSQCQNILEEAQLAWTQLDVDSVAELLASCDSLLQANVQELVTHEGQEELIDAFIFYCETVCHVASAAVSKNKPDLAYKILRRVERLITEKSIFHSCSDQKAEILHTFGCFYQKMGRHEQAANYLGRCADMDVYLSPTALAATLVNLSAVLSCLDRHQEALDRASYAIDLLKNEPPDVSAWTLAAAYHNVAVECEALGRVEQCIWAYQRAYEQAIFSIGNHDPRTSRLRALYLEARSKYRRSASSCSVARLPVIQRHSAELPRSQKMVVKTRHLLGGRYKLACRYLDDGGVELEGRRIGDHFRECTRLDAADVLWIRGNWEQRKPDISFLEAVVDSAFIDHQSQELRIGFMGPQCRSVPRPSHALKSFDVDINGRKSYDHLSLSHLKPPRPQAINSFCHTGRRLREVSDVSPWNQVRSPVSSRESSAVFPRLRFRSSARRVREIDAGKMKVERKRPHSAHTTRQKVRVSSRSRPLSAGRERIAPVSVESSWPTTRRHHRPTSARVHKHRRTSRSPSDEGFVYYDNEPLSPNVGFERSILDDATAVPFPPHTGHHSGGHHVSSSINSHLRSISGRLRARPVSAKSRKHRRVPLQPQGGGSGDGGESDGDFVYDDNADQSMTEFPLEHYEGASDAPEVDIDLLFDQAADDDNFTLESWNTHAEESSQQSPGPTSEARNFRRENNETDVLRHGSTRRNQMSRKERYTQNAVEISHEKDYQRSLQDRLGVTAPSSPCCTFTPKHSHFLPSPSPRQLRRPFTATARICTGTHTSPKGATQPIPLTALPETRPSTPPPRKFVSREALGLSLILTTKL